LARHLKNICAYFMQVFKGWSVIPLPQWLKDSRWKPQIVLGNHNMNNIIAVDIISSGVIPRMQYRGEVKPLLDTHTCLRTIVCVVDDALEQHPEAETFCKDLGLGLYVFHPRLGLEPVVRIDSKQAPLSKELPTEKGWFPEAILEHTRRLNNLSFRNVILDFSNRVNTLNNDRDKTCQLIKDTIDSLMQKHPIFKSNVSHFMKLHHFEKLFEFASPGATDHVLHSFRVFLAGCAIIDSFYNHFRKAHHLNHGSSGEKVNIEYIWLLTSIFHDIGRPKEGIKKLIECEINDEDLDVQIRGKDNRWSRTEYQNARKSLASFAVYMASGCKGGWDCGLIEDDDAIKIGIAWMRLYNEMESHAIISAFDFLAHVFHTATAAAQRKYRAFVVSHAVPAALAILLHDWRTWGKAKDWGLFPIDGVTNPMAALLIYLDTWDDYKRRGADQLIVIRSFTVDKDGAEVVVEWGEGNKYDKEKIKYEAFLTAIQKNLPFKLKINHGILR
jgi:hypothetical protein